MSTSKKCNQPPILKVIINENLPEDTIIRDQDGHKISPYAVPSTQNANNLFSFVESYCQALIEQDRTAAEAILKNKIFTFDFPQDTSHAKLAEDLWDTSRIIALNKVLSAFNSLFEEPNKTLFIEHVRSKVIESICKVNTFPEKGRVYLMRHM